MNKSIKLPPVGTPVFDIHYGWGKITSIAEDEFYSIYTCFENNGSPIGYAYTSKGKSENGSVPTLSVTEYDLVNGGFTPVTEWNMAKIGDTGYFWDEGTNEYNNSHSPLKYGVLTNINSQSGKQYEANGVSYWTNFSPEVPEWYLEKMAEIINKQKP